MKLPRSPPPHAFEPARDEQAFRFRSGASARSLAELEERLREAPPDVVAYHRQHFAPWLREVVGDEPLSRRFEALAEEGAAPDVLRDALCGLVRARLDELRRAGATPAR